MRVGPTNTHFRFELLNQNLKVYKLAQQLRMITNPEYLSKERLKNELKSHGIRYNNNENKQYYVNLYRERIMGSSEGMHGFSSDEEFVQRPGKTQRKQSPVKRKKTVKLDTYLSEVQGLADEELKEELEQFGADCGPIIDSTRILYQRKLAKLMSQHVTGKSPAPKPSRHRESSEEEEDESMPTNESFVGEWSTEEDEGEEEEEEVQIVDSGRTYQAPPVAAFKRGGESSIRERPKRPPVRPVNDTPNPAKQRPKPRKQEKSGSAYYSFGVLLLMFIVAFLSYEHYTSHEGDPSLLTKGWKEVQCGWNWLKGYILKTRPAPTVPPSEPPPTAAPSSAPPGTKGAKGAARGSDTRGAKGAARGRN